LQPDAVALSLDDGGVTVEAIRGVYAGPILGIGGANSEEAIAQLLDDGADDHVQATTGPVELAARVVALLRRRDDPKKALQVGLLQVDRERRVVLYNEHELELTAYEFRVLEVLARQSERVVQHHEIIAHVWGKDVTDSHTLAVLVSRLRRKLASVPGVKLETVMGIGYRLRECAAPPLPGIAMAASLA
jgi:DNA-binding response OmpR family regulator